MHVIRLVLTIRGQTHFDVRLVHIKGLKDLAFCHNISYLLLPLSVISLVNVLCFYEGSVDAFTLVSSQFPKVYIHILFLK